MIWTNHTPHSPLNTSGTFQHPLWVAALPLPTVCFPGGSHSALCCQMPEAALFGVLIRCSSPSPKAGPGDEAMKGTGHNGRKAMRVPFIKCLLCARFSARLFINLGSQPRQPVLTPLCQRGGTRQSHSAMCAARGSSGSSASSGASP